MSVKAFDLVPAVERVCWTEKVKTVITCLEISGRNLYVGTQECFIIHYFLEEKSLFEGTVTFNATKKNRKYIEFKKPIVVLKALSALNRILVLCDGNLLVLNMSDLEIVPSMTKLKNISYFCINENPNDSNPFSVEVCLSKKRQLLICHITDDKISLMKDVNVPESTITMAMDGKFVCLAQTSKYVIVNIESGHVQELYPYDHATTPLVKRITKEEFLLGGPSALGMFATTAGISERPPLQWGDNVISLAYYQPYIIVLSSDALTIFSILDQHPKQRLLFQGGTCLGNFEGKIFVAALDIICTLLPVPWEKQVQALLADRKVAEALELATCSNKGSMSKEQVKRALQRIELQAGFIEFSLLHFEEAEELFHKAKLDVRELISLFPDLVPSSSSFTRTNPPLHSIGHVKEMCSFDAESIALCRQFLLKYLEGIRHSSLSTGYKLEIDTSMLKLYAEMDSSALLQFLSSPDIGCHSKDGIDALEQHGCFHALAFFHHKLGQKDQALHIWSKIISGELQDEMFPGLPHFVDFLSQLDDHLLLWKYVDFVLERDQKMGVKIFTNRPSSETASERLRPDFIVDYLHRFPTCLVMYLEHLIFEKKLEKEKFHTHLAIIYMDSVLHILKCPEPEQSGLLEARKKLQHLLHMSSIYRVQLLLGKAIDNQLHNECAILYGKLEEHEKALKILVHELEDHQAAEDYCLRMSAGKDKKYKHRLFYTLLGVYLDKSMDEHQREEMLPPAIQLLNSEFAEFDVAKVLQLVPSHWSVAILDQFLVKALRSSLHHRYCSRLQRALSRGENLQIKFSKIHLESTSVLMTEERVCGVCKSSFGDPSFARHSSGLIAHPQCAKQLQPSQLNPNR